MYLLAIICPPLAVIIAGKPIQGLLNIFLSLCFYVPGLIHALFVVSEYKADGRAGLHNPDKNSAAYKLGQKMAARKEPKSILPEPRVQPAPTVGSALDDIIKLGELRDQGLITEEEFTIKKKAILGI